MKTPLPQYLAELLTQCAPFAEGELANYIPELAQADPDKLAIAICTTDGVVYAAGDVDDEFTIQSISKPFAYALAMQTNGLDAVLRKVGVEPSGENFNELSLEKGSARPRNPMINVGAIATHAMLPGHDGASRADALKTLLESMAGRSLQYDEAVYTSERNTAFRNLSLAYMLRNAATIQGDVADIVDGYTRQCAIRVNVQDLARMAAILANQGKRHDQTTHQFERATVRQVLSVMTSCGMYNGSGEWLARVGIPAKSGVSGGILGLIPGQLGVAVFSPRLDAVGNSVRGVRMLERLSNDMGLHLMEALQTPRASLRNPDVDVRDDIDLYELQGDIHFAQAELLLRQLQHRPASRGPVLLDVSRITELSAIAARMLGDAMEATRADGDWVGLIDPHELFQNATFADGTPIPRFERLKEAIHTACEQQPLAP